jgi:hypothetical protein
MKNLPTYTLRQIGVDLSIEMWRFRVPGYSPEVPGSIPGITRFSEK